MAAIEYGSFYWGVVLNGPIGKSGSEPGELVHLHADEMAIDPSGNLTFKSAGRRPAGSEPQQAHQGNGKQDDKKSNNNNQKNQDNKDQGGKNSGMIYVAFAAGTWKAVYAAKLQDGSPASIEHWATPEGNSEAQVLTPAHSGAAGYFPARE
jgi:hypothetical protein